MAVQHKQFHINIIAYYIEESSKQSFEVQGFAKYSSLFLPQVSLQFSLFGVYWYFITHTDVIIDPEHRRNFELAKMQEESYFDYLFYLPKKSFARVYRSGKSLHYHAVKTYSKTFSNHFWKIRRANCEERFEGYCLESGSRGKASYVSLNETRILGMIEILELYISFHITSPWTKIGLFSKNAICVCWWSYHVLCW